MLENSNNWVFRSIDKVIEKYKLSSFHKMYRFSTAQQIVATLDPFFSHTPRYYNLSVCVFQICSKEQSKWEGIMSNLHICWEWKNWGFE